MHSTAQFSKLHLRSVISFHIFRRAQKTRCTAFLEDANN